MSTNLHAIIRYRTLDDCLRKRRYWTLEELAERCGDALADATGKEAIPHTRTIAEDLAILRKGTIFTPAPIIYNRKEKGYRYSDTTFSIQTAGLNPQEVVLLKQGIETIRVFSKADGLEDLFQTIKTLEKKLNIESPEDSFVFLDHVPQYEGSKHITDLVRARQNVFIVKLSYLPFGWTEPINTEFQPFFLKEFNNRWFVYGRNQTDMKVYNYALDRIRHIEVTDKLGYTENYQEILNKLKRIVGVTIPDPFEVEEIVIKVSKYRSYYLLTKPIHPSQQLIQDEGDWVQFRLYLAINRELISLLQSLGNDLIVLHPPALVDRMLESAQSFIHLTDLAKDGE